MTKTLTYCESLTYRSDSGRCCQRSSDYDVCSLRTSILSGGQYLASSLPATDYAARCLTQSIAWCYHANTTLTDKSLQHVCLLSAVYTCRNSE